VVTHEHRDDIKHAARVIALGYVVLVAALLLVGFTLTHPLNGYVGKWDESVNRWFVDHRTARWNTTTAAATWVVNTVPAIGVAAVITAVLAAFKRFREAVMLLIALALELLVFLSVTFVVARPRPNVPRLNATPSTSSFPSGHTAAATVLFAGLAIIVTCCTANMASRVIACIFAVVATIAVGFARVYRGLHHPTDVVIGGLLGAACLIVAIQAVRLKRSEERPERRRDHFEHTLDQ